MMSLELVAVVVVLAAILAVGVFHIGRLKGRDDKTEALEMLWRYMMAVDDLDRWCGASSPHARLIARHLKAHGEGLGCNAGTPCGDEACTVSGLREQLRRLDGKGHA